MERAKAIWEELGLPALKPEAPWFGYSLGEWPEELDEAAERAVKGDYFDDRQAHGQAPAQGRGDEHRGARSGRRQAEAETEAIGTAPKLAANGSARTPRVRGAARADWAAPAATAPSRATEAAGAVSTSRAGDRRSRRRIS